MLAFFSGSLSSQIRLQAQRSGAPLPNKPQLGTLGERINANTIAIISGNPNATYMSIAYDMSAVLDDGDEFRILPVIGKGGGQNIKDVRFLKGVDLGITQSNLLGYYKRTNEIGTIDDKIVYIAKLFNEEMHLIVREGAGINSLADLAGKKVNFSDIGSGTQLSTRDIFERLGIKPVEVNMGQADAFEALKKGEIAATILIAGKPAGSMARLKAQDGFRILPVAFDKPLQADYLPATLATEDYPGLIAPGQKVETIAVSAVLIAFNWPKGTDRYRRIQKFVDAFLPAACRIPEGAAASEMEGSQSRRGDARLEALRRRRRMAAQARHRRRKASASSSTSSSPGAARRPPRSLQRSATACSRNSWHGGRASAADHARHVTSRGHPTKMPSLTVGRL